MLEAMELRQTYPWSWYVDDGVLRAEQERIFGRTWQYVGHTAQIPEPGSYFTGRAGLLARITLAYASALPTHPDRAG